jgi:hypothetical protein
MVNSGVCFSAKGLNRKASSSERVINSRASDVQEVICRAYTMDDPY